MSDLAKMAGKGMGITIKGKPYTLSQLTIDDLADFEKEVRSAWIKDFQKNTEDTLDNKTRKEILIELSTKEIMDIDLFRHMSAMSGLRFLLWKSLIKNHPEIKLNEMGSLIDAENFDELFTLMNTSLGLREENSPKNPKGRAKGK